MRGVISALLMATCQPAFAVTVTMDFTLYDDNIAHLRIIGDPEGATTNRGIAGRILFDPNHADILQYPSRDWAFTDGEPWNYRPWCIEDYPYKDWALVDVWNFTPADGDWYTPKGIDNPLEFGIWFEVLDPAFTVSWDTEFGKFFGLSYEGMTASPYAVPVPEPSSALLMWLGLLTLGLRRFS